MRNHLFLFLFGLLFFSTQAIFGQKAVSGKKYKTERVIVLVIDGPRYSETWGDKTHQYIPHMANDMAKTGVVCTNFYNDGPTYTSSGHAAICTGFKQELENSKGTELPDMPSVFQYYLKSSGVPSSKAWLITSKDKLWILGNCKDPEWKDQYNPSHNCGKNGPNSHYRNDSTTFEIVMNVLQLERPNLLVVNFREPDISGHKGDWKNYLKGIVDTDSLAWEVWKYIQNDPYYKDKTTLFLTNDHGRHLDGVKDGFVNHGDGCEGCRHINLFAFGPDFKQNIILNKNYYQVDIPATIAELLNFSMPHGEGYPMKALFK